MSDATITPVQRTEETSMSHPARIWLTHMIPWSAALFVPIVLAACPQPGTAVDDAKAAEKRQTQLSQRQSSQRPQSRLQHRFWERGSWYLSPIK